MQVPPPQTEVNIKMVSLAALEADIINVYSEYTEIVFNQYVDPATVANITLKDADGNVLTYTLSYDTSETDLEGNVYAKIYKVVYETAISEEESINIIIPNTIISTDGKACTEDTITMACRKETRMSVAESADVETASGYAIEALNWAVTQGIISGKPGADGSTYMLDPTGTATRAEWRQ